MGAMVAAASQETDPAKADTDTLEIHGVDHVDLRRFTFGACWFQFFVSGVFYSLSPLALPVSHAFSDHDDHLKGGLIFYGFAVLMAAQSICCGVSIFVVHQWSVARKCLFVKCAHLAWPVGLAFLALSVQMQSVLLALALAFPLMGLSIGVQVGYVHLVATAEMWGQRVNVGHATTGGVSAFGALVWNFVFGEVINAVGFDSVVGALWFFCALHAAGILVGVLLFPPMAYYTENAKDVTPNMQDGRGEAAKPMSFAELRQDWRVYLFTFVVEAFFCAGLTMKTMMSELFEKILSLAYIDAVRYSGGCLVAYVFARSLSPLCAAGDNVFKLFWFVLAFEGLAYALTPFAIDLGGGANVALYTLFRVIGGSSFAILLSNTSVFLVRVFGSQNIARISGIFLASEMFVGLGPTLAFSWHLRQVESGSVDQHSYDAAFYFCAALVFIAALGTMVLERSTRKARLGQEVSLSSSEQKVVETIHI
eukprot:TRINITY_DN46112_c0_g1_i1.p1 TRINITY_DN46112_c0_g1~~TRINITY_DN46112_c0_g1_i1.p1  ORF type:complete len:479 (+),score=77.32 TRINITY_DN46112_c0_g1_i1:24-1460(+)